MNIVPRTNHFFVPLNEGIFFGLGTAHDESLLSDTYFLPYTDLLEKSDSKITPTTVDINLLPDEGMAWCECESTNEVLI